MTASFRTRIKVCGITRLEDALQASELGIDAIGFVFYKNSPRYIEPVKAAAIIRKLPPFVSVVGLFVNPKQSEIDAVLAACPLDIIQLHGDESADFCAAQTHRVIKAIAIDKAKDLKKAKQYHCPILLDTKAPKGIYGGTGLAFDWSVLQGFTHDYPLILAGGLKLENIQQAISHRQWFAVDVSSGVEACAGIKDHQKMRDFAAQLSTSFTA